MSIEVVPEVDVSALALEATLTAIKGAGWTTETLVAIMAAIVALPPGATAAQVWAYATRNLTNPGVASNLGNMQVDGLTQAPAGQKTWPLAVDYTAARAANLDAAISSRSTLTQAQMLSDATPFPGARIDATISSRLAAASYTAERGTDNAALAVDWTAARAAYLDATISSRLAAASYTPERGTDNAMLAANGALESTLIAIKGAGWTIETLHAIYDAIAAITPGASAADIWSYVTRRLTNLDDVRAAKIDNLDAAVSTRSTLTDALVWAYATRKLTDYHISSGVTGNSLADGTSLTPAAGYRFYIWTTPAGSMRVQGYIGVAWESVGDLTYVSTCLGYQKVASGVGAWRLLNETGASRKYVYQWENVGASPVQPYKPTPGELVLEETPDYIITVPERWLQEHKEAIEADAKDILGWGRHREVLTTMGFYMLQKEELKDA